MFSPSSDVSLAKLLTSPKRAAAFGSAVRAAIDAAWEDELQARDDGARPSKPKAMVARVRDWLEGELKRPDCHGAGVEVLREADLSDEVILACLALDGEIGGARE